MKTIYALITLIILVIASQAKAENVDELAFVIYMPIVAELKAGIVQMNVDGEVTTGTILWCGGELFYTK